MSFDIGSISPSEARELRDHRTGALIIQITSHNSINHHLYPLTCCTTPDMQWVIFASNRAGSWQFFKARFPKGEMVQMTNLPNGVHGYSGHLTHDGRELIYTAHGQVRAVDVETFQERTLAAWDGASLGEVNLSPSGDWLVTAMKWKGKNYLAVVKTDGATAELIFESERILIHPQFHPTDDTLIEYAQDPASRMWFIRRDGNDNTCLYEHNNEEFVVHETWLGTTGDLIFVHWHFALKRLRLVGASLPPPTSAFATIAKFNVWHIAPNRAGTKVICDTNHPDIGVQIVDVVTGEKSTVCYPQASCQGSQWRQTRYATKEELEQAGKEKGVLSWMEAKGDTVYGPQWTHPHPSWSADEHWCLYDSDRFGTTQVFAVKLPDMQG
jgi:hypothetical protein